MNWKKTGKNPDCDAGHLEKNTKAGKSNDVLHFIHVNDYLS